MSHTGRALWNVQIQVIARCPGRGHGQMFLVPMPRV